jgi:hypothetical protein
LFLEIAEAPRGRSLGLTLLFRDDDLDDSGLWTLLLLFPVPVPARILLVFFVKSILFDDDDLLDLEDGFNNEARLLFEVGEGLLEVIMLVTAEAADLAMDTVMGEGTIILEAVVASRILLRANLALWSFGVTVVPTPARGCSEVDSLKRPLGIPGWPPLELPPIDVE